MTKVERQRIEKLTAISGLHPVIVNFAVFNGFRLGSEDQSLAEQVRVAGKRLGLSRRESLDLIADNFRDAITEFYSTAFPVVRRNK